MALVIACAATFAYAAFTFDSAASPWPWPEGAKVDSTLGHTSPGSLELEAQAAPAPVLIPVEGALEGGHHYLLEGFARTRLVNCRAELAVHWLDEAGEVLTETGAAWPEADLDWARLQLVVKAPAEAHKALLVVKLVPSPGEAPAGSAWFDDLRLVRSCFIQAGSSRKSNVFFAPRPVKAELTVTDLPLTAYDLRLDYQWLAQGGRVVEEGNRPFVEYSDRRELNLMFRPREIGQFYLVWRLYGKGIPDLYGQTGYALLPRPDRRPYYAHPPLNLRADLRNFKTEEALSNVCYALKMPGTGWIRDSLDLAALASEPDAYLERQRTLLETQRVAGLRVLKFLTGFAVTSNDAPDERETEKLLEMAALQLGNELEAVQLWSAKSAAEAGLTPADYVRLARCVSLVFGKANPNCKLVLGSLQSAPKEYADALLAEGVLKYVDALAIEAAGTPEQIAEAVYAARDFLHKAGAARKVWVTGLALPVAADALADFLPAYWRFAADLVKTTALCLEAHAARLFVSAWDEQLVTGQQARGALSPELAPRAAYGALSALLEQIGEGHYLGRLPLEKDATVLVFDSSRGLVALAWSDSPLQVTLPAYMGTAKVLDLMGNPAPSQGPTITLSPTPLYLAGLPAAVEKHLVQEQ